MEISCSHTPSLRGCRVQICQEGLSLRPLRCLTIGEASDSNPRILRLAPEIHKCRGVTLNHRIRSLAVNGSHVKHRETRSIVRRWWKCGPQQYISCISRWREDQGKASEGVKGVTIPPSLAKAVGGNWFLPRTTSRTVGQVACDLINMEVASVGGNRG